MPSFCALEYIIKDFHSSLRNNTENLNVKSKINEKLV